MMMIRCGKIVEYHYHICLYLAYISNAGLRNHIRMFISIVFIIEFRWGFIVLKSEMNIFIHTFSLSLSLFFDMWPLYTESSLNCDIHIKYFGFLCHGKWNNPFGNIRKSKWILWYLLEAVLLEYLSEQGQPELDY